MSSQQYESSKEKSFDIHDFYKADENTPPRFKSLSEIQNKEKDKLPFEQKIGNGQSKSHEPDSDYLNNDKFLIELEDAGKSDVLEEEKIRKCYLKFQIKVERLTFFKYT